MQDRRSQIEQSIREIRDFIAATSVKIRNEPDTEFFESHAYVEIDVEGDLPSLIAIDKIIARRWPNVDLVLCEESHGKVFAGTVENKA